MSIQFLTTSKNFSNKIVNKWIEFSSVNVRWQMILSSPTYAFYRTLNNEKNQISEKTK